MCRHGHVPSVPIEVEIRFYAHLRDVVGTKTLVRAVPEDATVGDVIDGLVADYPDLESHLFEDGSFRTTAVVRKDRTNVSLDAPVDDGDVVSLTTQIVGG
jgi:molybdopterin converting factor small subunit